MPARESTGGSGGSTGGSTGTGTGRGGAKRPSRRGAKRPARRTFPGISSRAYEHPADRGALVTLRAVPGFDTVLKAMFGFFSERRLRMMHLGSAVRVSERQFAGLHAIHADNVGVLDAPFTPELYVVQDPRVNAWTLGLDHPFISISSGTLDLLDEDELRTVLGHELGHVMSGHALYSSVLFTLLRASGVAASLPIGSLGLRAIVTALKEWYRKAELSCDRAALLAGQDPAAATRVHMKMAGGSRVGEMDLTEFLAQADEYESSGDVREGVIRVMNLLNATHPFSVLRALELRRWVESGEYERILAGDYPLRDDDPSTSIAEEVKAAAASYKKSFDESPDPLIKLVRDIGGGAVDVGGWVADRLRRMTGGG